MFLDPAKFEESGCHVIANYIYNYQINEKTHQFQIFYVYNAYYFIVLNLSRYTTNQCFKFYISFIFFLGRFYMNFRHLINYRCIILHIVIFLYSLLTMFAYVEHKYRKIFHYNYG